MKRVILLITAVLITAFVLPSCNKEDAWTFDYPKETLCGGTWKGIAIKSEGIWFDITGYTFARLQFSIRFNSDGTYYGQGYFGNGSGTYKVSASAGTS